MCYNYFLLTVEEKIMNLKKQTIEVLRNFNGINQGILFREGNTIRTMSVMRTIFASAVVEDVFPKEFAIYDLGEFLSTISLFENPDIQFKDEYFIVAEGTSKVKYFYSNPNVVVSAPEKQVAMPTPDVTFNLAKSQIDQLLKASAVMKLKDFAVTDGGVKVFNRNSVGNQYTIDLEMETNGNKGFEYTIKVDNLKFIPSDYAVAISSKGISQFKSTACKDVPELEYFVALDSE
jgi:hypothetical protein